MERKRTNACGDSAFTLAEVALAAIVLAMAITGALAAMQRAFLQLDDARNFELAANILQCEMEKERLIPWTLVSDATYRPTIDSAFLSQPTVAARFTLSRNVVALPDHSGQLVLVTLTLNWRTLDGRTVSRSYRTYFGQGGLQSYFHGP